MESVPIYKHEGVVFPNCVENIRISDPVSVAMLRTSLSLGRPVGILPAGKGSDPAIPIYGTGTLAEPLAMHEPDVLEVEVAFLGRRRFRIIEPVDVRGHPGAKVIPVEDTDLVTSREDIRKARAELSAMYERLSLRLRDRVTPLNMDLLESSSDTEFSFLIAGSVRFPREEKIRLLETISTRERLEMEIELIRSFTPVQRKLI